MRLLVVSDLYPPVAFGGYELDCEATVRSLRERHEVTVLTSRLARDSAPDEPGVVRALPWVGTNRRLRETAGAPVAAARAARVMRGALAGLRPDLVFAFNCVGIPQAAPVAALEAGVPVAIRLAETFFATELLWGDRFLRHLRGGERLPRAAWGAVVRGVNRVDPALRLHPERPSRVAISWASRDLRSRTRLPAAMDAVHERVIHPASRHFAGFGAARREPAAEPTILYLGRVTVGKGIEVAVRALARLAERPGPRPRLRVLGHADPATQRRVEALIAGLGLDGAVTLEGHVAEEQIEAAMRTAHAIVVPSLVLDVFPLAVVEAALARLPIVASRVGGIPEAVVDGEQALLFEAGDADACAAALARVLDDPAAAEARAAAARARMLELTPERYAAESEEFVSEALERLRGR